MNEHRSRNTKRVQLNRDGFFINGSGISMGGLAVVLFIALVVELSDDRWWAPLAVLSFIPLVIIYGLALRALGFESVPSHIRPINGETAEAKAVEAYQSTLERIERRAFKAWGGEPDGDPPLVALDAIVEDARAVLEKYGGRYWRRAGDPPEVRSR